MMALLGIINSGLNGKSIHNQRAFMFSTINSAVVREVIAPIEEIPTESF